MNLYDQNRQAWDERVRQKKWYIDTATAQDFLKPLAVADPRGWLGPEVAGKRILCLAAGGGRHGPLFAAAGARVTVADLSPAMLELDRAMARERGLELKLVEASMDDLSALPEAGFDAVFQPVSTCYVPDVQAVYREVARVLAPDGLYLSQHKQPAALQSGSDWTPPDGGYVVREPYYRAGPLPPAPSASLHRETGTIEFLHRWEELLGGLCRSGFVIEDVVEPRRWHDEAQPGEFEHRSRFLPPFVAIKARRTAQPVQSPVSRLWVPGS